MNSIQIMIAMFCAIGVAQGFFVAFYLLSTGREPKLPNLLLSGLLLGVSLRISKSIYYYLFDGAPIFLVALGLAGLLAIGPFLWLYVKSLTEAHFKWRNSYILHVTPALAAAVFGSFLPIDYFSFGYHGGAFLMLFYIATAWWTGYNNRDSFPSNPLQKRWLFSVLTGVTIIWSSFIYQAFSSGMANYAYGAMLACLVFYWLFYEALRNPAIFSNKRSNGGKKSVTRKVARELAQKLEHAFKEEQVYHDPNLTLTSLSQKLDTPTYLVSRVINKHFGMSFPEFVNDHRIREVQDKLQNANGDFIKIEALAYEVGFNSPSAFYNAFKKKTALTPQEYRNQFVREEA